MRLSPDTTARLTLKEAAQLELDAEAEPTSVRLLPRIGEEATLPLDGGPFGFPFVAVPNIVAVEWDAAGSSGAACRCVVEVVSRHYFEIGQLRGYGDGQDSFNEMDEARLLMARQAATEVFEQAAGRSFVRRIGRTKDYGTGELLVLAHHDVGEVLTPGYAQASDSQLRRGRGCGPFPRWVEYVYGRDAMPAEVSRAVLELAAYTLRPSNRPIGATGESSDAGYIHFTTAGRDGATSIPEVNAAIEQFGAGRAYVW